MAAVLAVLVLVTSLAASVATPTAFSKIAQQADAARNADRMQEAINLYSEGVHLRPTWQDGWWWLGSLLYDQDRFLEADRAFTRFVAISAKPAPAYAFLGLCQYEIHDYADALASFQKWARLGSPGNDQLIDVAGFHWAVLLTREGHFVEALYLLAAKAQKLGPNPSLIEAMGLASLRMRNITEDYPREKREMVWLAGLAAVRASLQPRQFDVADYYSNRLVERYGQQQNVHYFRGTLLKFEDKQAEAEQEFLKELQISPKHVPAMLELARMRLVDDSTSAMTYASASVEMEPQNAEAHHLFGRALFAERRFPECVRELETAKRLAPDSASVRYQLAEVYRKLGRKQEAAREAAAFNLLKDKQEVMAPPEEKLHPSNKPSETSK